MTTSPARLSVCVATTAGWPAIEPCLRSFLDEARAAGAEILVADGSGRPPPDDPAIAEQVDWHADAGASIFRLLRTNLERATGEIVATTEDHCTVRPGWVAGILRAHEEYPDAVAVGGTIENGTDTTQLQWASYLMTQGAHMGPLRNGPAPRIANEADISFKRRALADLGDELLGFLTIGHTRRLADRGELLVNDDRIVVDHYETLDARSTAVIHFDDGRTISGFRRRKMAASDWLRLVGAPVLPLYRVARVVRVARAKGRTRTALSALPWLLLLAYCHEAGEFVGYLAGPGQSPYGLR